MSMLPDLFASLMDKAKPHAHEILIGAGMTAGVLSTIEACKATRKLDKMLEPHKKNIEDIHAYYEGKYNTSEYKRALSKEYAALFKDIAILYGKSAILGVAAGACILKGTDLSSKTIASLSSSLVAYEAYVRKYRERVAKIIGREQEEDLYHNLETKEVIEVTKDNNGNDVVVKKKYKVKKDLKTDLFTRIFAPETSVYHRYRDAFGAKSFVKGVEDTLNAIGKERAVMHLDPYVTLNEALDRLGFDQVPYGNLYVWRFGKKCVDNDVKVIDFGLDDVTYNCELANAQTGTIFIRLNVDDEPIISPRDFSETASVVHEY